MAIVVLCVGAFLTLLGIAGYLYGMDLLPTERGVAGVISATVAVVGGVLTISLGLILQKLDALMNGQPLRRPAPTPDVQSASATAPAIEPKRDDDTALPDPLAEPVPPIPEQIPLRPKMPKLPDIALSPPMTAAAGGAAAMATFAERETDRLKPLAAEPADAVAPSPPEPPQPKKGFSLPKLDFKLGRRETATASPVREAEVEYPTEVLKPLDDAAPVAKADAGPAAKPAAYASVPMPADDPLANFEAEFNRLLPEPKSETGKEAKPEPKVPSPRDAEQAKSDTKPSIKAEPPRDRDPDIGSADRKTSDAPKISVDVVKSVKSTPAVIAASTPDARVDADVPERTLPVPDASDKDTADASATDMAPATVDRPSVESEKKDAGSSVAAQAKTEPGDGDKDDEPAALSQPASQVASLSEPPVADQPKDAEAADVSATAADEPAEKTIPRPAAGVEIVGAYESGGAKYTMYSDGSVIAEAGGETLMFKSLEELRDFIEAGSKT